MKRFLAIYLGSSTSNAGKEWASLDEQTRKAREKAGMTAWMAWGQKLGGTIIDHGAPLGKTKRIDARGVFDTKNLMTAYTIVEAESHAAAAELFMNHPHFAIFPGDAIEVMECLPIPKL